MRGGIDQVYALAADMGGMGFISANHAEILHNNALINLHTIEAARQAGVKRYLYTSCACIYPEYLQTDAERDAPPRGGRLPGPAAGRVRLGEARHREALRVLPRATTGSRRASSASTTSTGPTAPTTAAARRPRPPSAARSPASTTAARSRSGATASRRRSFCYVDDCVEGIYRLMQSDHREPLNLGTDRMVTINELAEIITGDRRQAGHRHPAHRRPAGRPRPQLRQHPAARGPRLGAGDRPRAGARRDVPLDRVARPSQKRTPSWRRRRRSRDRGRSRRRPIPRVDILGVRVSAIDMTLALDEIERWIAEDEPALRVRHGRARRDGVAARPRAASDPQRVRAHDARRDADGLARAPRRRHAGCSACTGPT